MLLGRSVFQQSVVQQVLPSQHPKWNAGFKANRISRISAKKPDDASEEIKSQLEKSGLTPEMAKELLKTWQIEVGHELTPEDLRKILVGQSTKALVLVIFSTLLDSGAAYGAFVAGNYLGIASADYGWPAVIGQAVAYILAGYYVTGALFDFFKLGAVAFAALSFNVTSSSFLSAIDGIARSDSGLNVADKALDAANSLKVFQAMDKMVKLLRKDGKSGAESVDMLADLGAYLTLDKAERQFGFESSSFGLTEAEAASIAVIFSKYDLSKYDIAFICLDSSDFMMDSFLQTMMVSSTEMNSKSFATNFLLKSKLTRR